MNSMWVLAYIIMPVIVVALGYAAVRWNERDRHRHGGAE